MRVASHVLGHAVVVPN